MPHVRPYKVTDWPHIERITQEGIETGKATFDTSPKPQEKWEQESLSGTRLVAVDDAGTVLGWAALWATSNRCVYAGVAEVSVYVTNAAKGQGIGGLLMKELIERSEEIGIWTIQAGIFDDNIGSIALHEKYGFRLIGRNERIGKLNGSWRDTLQFERRSDIVGID